MPYSTGMTLAGALASGIPAIVSPIAGDHDGLLSDRLPSTVLYVSLGQYGEPVSAAADAALRAAYASSTQLVEIL